MIDPATISPVHLVACTLWGEARGESVEGKVAVAWVIRNRVVSNRYGKTYRDVVLAPMQFSCWQAIDGPENHQAVLALVADLVKPSSWSPVFRECLYLAEGVVYGPIRDNTRGATHYLTAALYASHPPSWAAKMRVMTTIGNHVFLREAA